MSIESIYGVSATTAAAGIKTGGIAGSDFGDWLTQQVEQLNRQILDGDTQVRKLAVGETTNMHQVMLTLEQAKLTFELAVQVRNKVLEAYQDILRMQI
jgi:flagellar hook-basal body complex protein FliE